MDAELKEALDEAMLPALGVVDYLLEQEGIMPKVATLIRNGYSALLDVGFTDVQAMQIICAYGRVAQ